MLPGAAAGSTPASGTGFTGQAIDLATLKPLAGARVQIEPLGTSTTTDQNGGYTLPTPPGTYSVSVACDGFLSVTQVQQVVTASGYTELDLDLVPENPTPDEQQVLYQRLVKQIEAPPPVGKDVDRQALKLTSSSIPSEIKVVFPDGSSQWMPLDDYVKGVVPYEVPSYWPMETLKAQAVAARTWGVARFLSAGWVCTTSACQVYGPDRYASTNEAVDATAGQVITANGSLISAFYFSQCNGQSTRNSWQYIAYSGSSGNQLHCTVGDFGYTSYCVARSCNWNGSWGGSDCGYHGHGVGMCQWGAFGQGQSGQSYTGILNSYYTGVAISGTTPAPPPPPTATPLPTPTPTPRPPPAPRPLGPFVARVGQAIVFVWSGSGSGDVYRVWLYRDGVLYGTTDGWLSSTYWSVGSLPLGSYVWTVQAQSPTTRLTSSAVSATLIVAEETHSAYLPELPNY